MGSFTSTRGIVVIKNDVIWKTFWRPGIEEKTLGKRDIEPRGKKGENPKWGKSDPGGKERRLGIWEGMTPQEGLEKGPRRGTFRDDRLTNLEGKVGKRSKEEPYLRRDKTQGKGRRTPKIGERRPQGRRKRTPEKGRCDPTGRGRKRPSEREDLKEDWRKWKIV